jgi:hypothetical protein
LLRYKYKTEERILKKYYKDNKKSDALKKLKKIYGEKYGDTIPSEDSKRIEWLCKKRKLVSKELNRRKQLLRDEFAKFSGTRKLREDHLSSQSIISVFDSGLDRTLSLKTNELADSLIVVRVYFFEVFKDIVLDGFYIGSTKYVCFTASAGQIRTKKCVFIREDLLRKNEKTIMCGLSVDKINELGGCNTNKYLAYLALCNSATDEWREFNIDKSIVVDDMETDVRGIVDYIDNMTYEITQQEMDVPITHTDGCGMILPRLSSGKNFMVRLPWVKGLLATFAFDNFINEFGGNHIIKDIYGKEHNIIKEGIEVIFTKSQFKLWKYYSSWEQYKEYFKKYSCHAGICNVEEDKISNATLNYQMLQTLCDLTDEELAHLAKATNNKLSMLSEDRATKLKVLGATEDNENRTPAQECLLLYPELLQDVYYRDELKNMKDSIEKWAWAGKLDIYGKYLFVIPDLFAFCQHLFLGKNNPSGLLENGEVYSALFSKCEKLDCLRSPHLYREHPVRTNVGDNPLCQKWFSERGIYTSCHDLISKVLQNDNDGDKLLVCGDKTLISAAERNMKNIVPLYYEMPKAGAMEITNESIYNGMVAAYTGGNIGIVSNTITKVWNSDKPDINLIKQLCLYNNFVID